MKRSEMVVLIAEHLIEPKSEDLMVVASQILKRIEDRGMLPPTNTCKLVPDTNRGGFKHSETKREWDSEEENA